MGIVWDGVRLRVTRIRLTVVPELERTRMQSAVRSSAIELKVINMSAVCSDIRDRAQKILSTVRFITVI